MGACGSSSSKPNGHAVGPSQKPVIKLDEKKDLNKHYSQENAEFNSGASCSVFFGQSRACDCHKHHVAGRTVAIKKILSSKDVDGLDLWRTETKILAQLDHPNIVQIVDSFRDKGFFVVTVFAEGGELFDRVSQKTKGFSEKDAARLTRQMLLALQHCHERNITHRDLKPENFVFDSPDDDANMRLIDFGVAKQVDDNHKVIDVAGSPYYVAPEILNSSVVKTGAMWKKADIWSIGVILFLLIHGRPPFNGRNQDAIFKRIRSGRYTLKQGSPEVRNLITQLLQKDPFSRPSVEEVLKHPWFHGAAPDDPFSDSLKESLKTFQESCRLRKAVRRMMAKTMTPTDRKRLAKLFKKYDVNNDGKLQANEIALMLKEVGSMGSVEQILREYDTNNDGDLDIEEFNQMHVDGRLNNEEEMKKMFARFDKDGDGHVTAEELEAQLVEFQHMTAEDAKKIFQEADKDGNGEIDFDEWLVAMGGKQKK